MDPLTLFVVSLVGAAALERSRDSGRPPLRSYYEKENPGFRGWIAMPGDRVTWWAPPGETVWIRSRYLRPIEGNIFDRDKLQAVARAVRSHHGPEFTVGYGQVSRVRRWQIEESIQYKDDTGYPPLTTGDEELDLYLADPEQFLDDNSWDDEERTELEARLEHELREAEEEGQGDFGEWMAVVRDGNHRVFGSVLGGEEKIPIRLYDNDVIDLQESLRKGFDDWRGEEAKALIQKVTEDSGEPEWVRRIEKTR